MPLPLTIDDHRRPLGPSAPPVLGVALQLRCLDEVMRACRQIAADAGRRSRTTRPSSLETLAAASAVLGTDADVDLALTRHLDRCAVAVSAASDGLVSLDQTARQLLVTTSRALHRDPSLSGQRSVLGAIEARRTWETHRQDGPDAERLDVGLALARAVVGAAWADCRTEVMDFRRAVADGRRASGPDPYLHVVAATVAGSLSGALTCPPDDDPRDAALALGLAGAVRQVVSAALAAGRARPDRG